MRCCGACVSLKKKMLNMDATGMIMAMSTTHDLMTINANTIAFIVIRTCAFVSAIVMSMISIFNLVLFNETHAQHHLI